MVVGGGNVAAEDAVFLSGLCERVYLVHRRDALRADQALQEKVFACENIEMVWDSVPLEILGQDEVTGLKIRNIKTNEERELTAEGVFIAVGIVPNTTLVKDQLKLDENGYICAGEEGVTSAPGVFAAGDIRTKALRQIVTAVSDGANAVSSVQKYLWRKDNGNDSGNRTKSRREYNNCFQRHTWKNKKSISCQYSEDRESYPGDGVCPENGTESSE